MSKEYVANQTLSLLRDKLRQAMNDKADDVATGGCRNFEEYSKQVGFIEGLAYAERELIDLSNRLEGPVSHNGEE